MYIIGNTYIMNGFRILKKWNSTKNPPNQRNIVQLVIDFAVKKLHLYYYFFAGADLCFTKLQR